MNQTSENREKPNLGSDFGTFDLNLSPQIFFVVLPLLDVRQCGKLLSHVISKKTSVPNARKCRKTSFWA